MELLIVRYIIRIYVIQPCIILSTVSNQAKGKLNIHHMVRNYGILRLRLSDLCFGPTVSVSRPMATTRGRRTRRFVLVLALKMLVTLSPCSSSSSAYTSVYHISCVILQHAERAYSQPSSHTRMY